VTSFQSAVAIGRRDAARNTIIDAAIGQFLSRGYTSVSVEDIAVAVGFSVRTFYRYFPSKEQVLISFALRSAEFLPRAIARQSPEDPPLQAMLQAAAEWDEEVESAFWTWVKISNSLPPLLSYIDGAVHAGLRIMVAEAARARWPQEVNPQLLAAVVVGVLSSVSEQTLLNGGDRRPLVADAIGVLRVALTDPPPSGPGLRR
jgi:AcrR family transcriptional regulator